MPFSLSNTHTVVADDIFLLQNVNLKNIYDIFATIEQLDNVTGFDQATIDILTNIANTMGGLPSTWYTDLVNSINLKRNITDSYSITYINSNFYNKTTIDNSLALKANQSTTFTKTEVNNLFNNYYNNTYIDTLIADYYTKLQVDALIANSGGGGGGGAGGAGRGAAAEASVGVAALLELARPRQRVLRAPPGHLLPCPPRLSARGDPWSRVRHVAAHAVARARGVRDLACH